jgi:Tfp pilus assembly protein PilN
MIEINLVPDVKQEFIKAQKIRSRVIAGAIMVGIISIGVVALMAFYIYAIQAGRNYLADESIKSSSKAYLKTADLSKTLTIQNQLTKISALNDDKKVDSRIFDLLNAIIPPAPNDVQVSDLTIDSTTNTITINGQASNSYAALEVFKKTIAGASVKYSDGTSETQSKTLASDISTTNTSYGEDSSGKKVLKFTLSFAYVPELFSPQSKNVSIVITANGNATDSYLGVPKSIWANGSSGGQ